MHSLQQAGGAYCVVAAHKDHDARASLRGFQEGDNLRVLRAKEDKAALVVEPEASWICIENDMGCTGWESYGHFKSQHMLARNSV